MNQYKVTNSHLLIYGMVGLPMAVATLPFTLYIPNYYTSEMGLSLTVVGGLLLLARLFDIITDPLMGILSDRIPIFNYYRKSWFFLAMPITVISLWMVFQPPSDVSSTYFLLWTLLFYLGWTMMQIPYQSWGAELSPCYHERSRIRASTEFFTIIGTVLAAAAPLLVGGEMSQVLALLAISLVILFPILSFTAIKLVPESSFIKQHSKVKERVVFKRCLKNPYFRRLIAAYFSNGIGDALSAVMVIFFIESVLKLKVDTGIFLSALFISSGLSVFLWLKLSYHLGKHRTWFIGLLWGSLCFAGIPFLSAGDFWPYLLICIGGGMGFASDAIFPPSMLADVIDSDTAKSGNQRTGAYFSLWGVSTKLALALPVGLALPLLEYLGFNPAGPSSEQGLLAVSLLYGAAPIVFKITAMILIWDFPIDSKKQSLFQDAIAQKKQSELCQ